MKKVERIELSIKDFDRNQTLITKVSTSDIHKYIKANHLKWDHTDIGRSQKKDLIKSIIKHNPKEI